MPDYLGSLESGEKYHLSIPGMQETMELPMVRIQTPNGPCHIPSLNLIGQVGWNAALGRALAEKIRSVLSDLSGVVFLTVVEKALQLAQVTGMALGVPAMAVAYNRIKPHMDVNRRPLIQVGNDSRAEGEKFLALYERDLNLILQAERGIVLIDDAVSSGGTILALTDLVDEAAAFRGHEEIPVLGAFAVAREADCRLHCPIPVYTLTELPGPVPVRS
jgi:adenine phosphoribosyltransferase